MDNGCGRDEKRAGWRKDGNGQRRRLRMKGEKGFTPCRVHFLSAQGHDKSRLPQRSHCLPVTQPYFRHIPTPPAVPSDCFRRQRLVCGVSIFYLTFPPPTIDHSSSSGTVFQFSPAKPPFLRAPSLSLISSWTRLGHHDLLNIRVCLSLLSDCQKSHVRSELTCHTLNNRQL